LATYTAADEFTVNSNLVVEDFSLNDGTGFTVSIGAGEDAIATDGTISVQVVTPDGVSADLEAAIDGDTLTTRNLEVSSSVTTTLRITIEYPQGRVENLDEATLIFVTSDPALTVTEVSLDTENNIGVWDLTGEFGATKGTDGLELGLGTSSATTGTLMPAAGALGLSLLSSLCLFAGGLFLWRRKHLVV